MTTTVCTAPALPGSATTQFHFSLKFVLLVVEIKILVVVLSSQFNKMCDSGQFPRPRLEPKTRGVPPCVSGKNIFYRKFRKIGFWLFKAEKLIN